MKTLGKTNIAWKERQSYGSLFEKTLRLVKQKISQCEKEGI